MPQLNPAPWLTYLLFSWMALSLIIIPKVMTHTFPESPTSQTKQKSQTEYWNWPWS